MDLETFLFGGEYFIQGDPCRSIGVEGTNSFDVYQCDEITTYHDFKDIVKSICDQFGWNDEDPEDPEDIDTIRVGGCDRCYLDPDNENHYIFDPTEDEIKHLYWIYRGSLECGYAIYLTNNDGTFAAQETFDETLDEARKNYPQYFTEKILKSLRDRGQAGDSNAVFYIKTCSKEFLEQAQKGYDGQETNDQGNLVLDYPNFCEKYLK